MDSKPVEILDPRPSWVNDFTRVGEALRRHLGPLALRIDHIGSTSVPGLPAKDVIDVQVTVAEEAGLEEVCTRRVADRWARRPYERDHQVPGMPTDEREWAKRFLHPPPGHRPVNLHVRIAGRANQRYALVFRDYLRAHPATAAAYAEAKRRLAALTASDLDQYALAKDPIVDLIYLAAEDWARRQCWAPGRSDI